MAELMEEAIEISDKLIPCNICGRTFLPTPLKKHYKVCEKNATRKRKTFDSLKQRIEGTDIAQFHKPTSIKKSENHHINVPPPIASVVTTNEDKINKNQSKWKEKHEALVQAIRAAKGGKEMSPRRSISAVGTMGTTEQCPSCDRHFGPKAYDRHVEWCKEHKGRTAKSPANVLIAKERLEARTKYRVPPLNKSKRSLTREKYATSSNRSESLTNVRSTSSLDKINLERNTGARKSKQSSVSVVPPNFQSVGEPIIKTKSPSTEKIKSSNFKYRIYPITKTNDININESVLGMTVSHLNCPSLPPTTKLITWKDTHDRQIDNTNVSNNNLPFTINIVDTENKFSINSESDTLKINTNETKNQLNIEQFNNTNKKINTNTIIEFSTNNSTYAIIEEDLISDKKSDDLNCDTDSLSEPETKRSEEVTFANEIITNTDMNLKDTYTNENIEIKNDSYREQLQLDEKDSSENVSAVKIWDLAEIEFLNSLKSNPDTFISGLNSTSTPVQENFENNSGISRTYFADISSREILQLSSAENLSRINDDGDCSKRSSDDMINISVNDSNKTLTDYVHTSYIDNNYEEKFVLEKESQCDEQDLDIFLKEKKSKCRLEVEIIASEIGNTMCNKEEEKISSSNLYRVNSSEIVIRGAKCIDTLNKSFSRNKIKHVNIVFVNEDTNNESEIIFESDLIVENNDNKPRTPPTKIVKYDAPLLKKASKLRKKSHLKHLKKQKKGLVFIPQEQIPTNDKHVLFLPFVRQENISTQKKKDNFWEKYTKSEDQSEESKTNIVDRDISINQHIKNANEYDNFTLPPIHLKNNNSDNNYHNNSFKLNSPSCTSPTRLPPISEEKNQSKEDYDPFVIAEKQLMELLQCDDFKPCKSTNKTPSPIPKSIPDKAFNKRSSSADYQDKIDILQDNFEMIENYINDNYVNIDESKNSKFSHKKNTGNSNLNKTDKNETLSLNSILSKRKYSDDINAIDPILINETDNLAIPDKLFVDSYSPEFCNDVDHYSVQYDRNISVLEPLVLPKTEVNMKRSISVQNNQPLDDVIFEELISSFNDDETFPTLKSFLQTSKSETNKSGKKIPQKSTHSLNSSYGKNSTMKNVDVKKHPLSPLKRSVSLTNPIVKARSMKNKQDIQDYLHVRDNKPSRMENEKLRDVSPNPSEELFPVDHDMYEEYKRYEEMYKKEKYDSSFDQPKTSEDFEKDDASSSEDNTHADRKHQIIKVSSDSAYGRKSPKVQTRLSNRHGQMYQSKQTNVGRSPSSSGSEVSVITKPKTTQRLTKFCHECGTKYPLDCAKFCVECGIKRLVL